MKAPAYVYRPYPKWIEVDGRRFIVPDEAEHRRQRPEDFPDAGNLEVVTAPETVTVDVASAPILPAVNRLIEMDSPRKDGPDLVDLLAPKRRGRRAKAFS